MNAEEKLNSLIAEYRLLKTEEEKKGFDEKMRHTLSEISPEERKKFRNAFLISQTDISQSKGTERRG